MRGARRRPYVDRVKPGNDADGAPERGAGAPLAGMRPHRRAQARGFNSARLARSGVAPTPRAQALLRPPRAPGRNPEGRGKLGASCCWEPLQYRHIAAGSPPKPASHIASVAHAPIVEIGSATRPFGPAPNRTLRAPGAAASRFRCAAALPRNEEAAAGTPRRYAGAARRAAMRG